MGRSNLRNVTVTFSDGDTINTDMNGQLSDDDIRSYYKIGKWFNLGTVDDKMVQVTKVDINN